MTPCLRSAIPEEDGSETSTKTPRNLHLSTVISAFSPAGLHGDHGDQRQRAGAPPPGGALCLHQEAIRSAEEEEAGLCPGLQRVTSGFSPFSPRNRVPGLTQDSALLRYLQTSLKADNQEVRPIEMSSLVGPINDLDSTPFRSLRPRSSIGSSGGGVSFPKTQGPVVCSVAPNLPVRPPSSSDNDSIRKNHWDMDYEGRWSCFWW